jgi:hypothetical protein
MQRRTWFLYCQRLNRKIVFNSIAAAHATPLCDASHGMQRHRLQRVAAAAAKGKGGDSCRLSHFMTRSSSFCFKTILQFINLKNQSLSANLGVSTVFTCSSTSPSLPQRRHSARHNTSRPWCVRGLHAVDGAAVVLADNCHCLL